jgi:hypothetical protein
VDEKRFFGLLRRLLGNNLARDFVVRCLWNYFPFHEIGLGMIRAAGNNLLRVGRAEPGRASSCSFVAELMSTRSPEAGAELLLDCAALSARALCAVTVPDNPATTKSEPRTAQQIAIITLFVISPLLIFSLSTI